MTWYSCDMIRNEEEETYVVNTQQKLSTPRGVKHSMTGRALPSGWTAADMRLTGRRLTVWNSAVEAASLQWNATFRRGSGVLLSQSRCDAVRFSFANDATRGTPASSRRPCPEVRGDSASGLVALCWPTCLYNQT